VTISNDGATIMKLLDIAHPAAKTLVDISMSQDAEVRTHKRQPVSAIGASYPIQLLALKERERGRQEVC